jgi:hypothetical protein
MVSRPVVILSRTIVIQSEAKNLRFQVSGIVIQSEAKNLRFQVGGGWAIGSKDSSSAGASSE